MTFTSKVFNFLFSFKELALIIILFSSSDTHLMLDITEVKALFFHLLFDSH